MKYLLMCSQWPKWHSRAFESATVMLEGTESMTLNQDCTKIVNLFCLKKNPYLMCTMIGGQLSLI